MRIRLTVMAGLATLAGSVGLYPLFTGRTWFWAGLGAVLSVAAGGLLVRRFRIPAVFNAIAGLAALHLYLTVVYASGEALFGVVPTAGSLRRLAALAGEGWEAANNYAAPVPQVPGIMLLAAAGVGLVAVLVDLLAVRLRRTAPAGLPLLAMYSVPAAVREDSVGWAAFAVGALGFLALLVTDAREQVGGWGRVVFTPRWSERVPLAGAAEEGGADDGGGRERPDVGALAASGRRIGMAAVAVAVLLPMAIPGVQPRGLFGLGGGGGGGGSQTVTTPDPLVSLKRELTRPDDAVVLTYRTDARERPDYLRLYALDRFDGDRWSYYSLQSTAKDRLTDQELPPPPGLGAVRTQRVTTRVKVERRVRNMTFLPVPYAPARVSIKGDWRMDAASRMVYSLRDSAGGRSYTVTSLQAMPTAQQLGASGGSPVDVLRRYTALPRTMPPEVVKLAHDVTTGALTPHRKAVLLQRWFARDGGFTYDLSAPPPQRGNDLTGFLLRDKRGYCEQFAAAMALMARALNIPARVAMGYTPGTQTAPGVWTVRSRDAHAWPELYFEGTGWVRFEPTPAGAAGQGTAVTPPYSEPTSDQAIERGTESAPAPTPAESAPATAGPDAAARRDLDRPDPGAGADGAEEEDGGAPTGWIAGTVLVLALLAAPMAARLVTRRRRWAAVPPAGPEAAGGRGGGDGPGGAEPDAGRTGRADGAGAAAHAAWREMRSDALDHGLAWRSSDTPRATARRLSQLLELDAETARALGRIARAEEMARYSPVPADAPAEALRADVRKVREAFAASVSRQARLRAKLLPPSTVASTRSATREALQEAAARMAVVTGRAGRVRDRVVERVRDRLPGGR
ncbi:DUF3488 and DUF4129 domain-containing transglutaminase family protein [Spirillospora sp. NPDC127200]